MQKAARCALLMTPKTQRARKAQKEHPIAGGGPDSQELKAVLSMGRTL
jgi:hypothetical protein